MSFKLIPNFRDRLSGKRMWLWRAVDDEGEVLDCFVQKRRNTRAAVRLLRKLLKHQGIHPEAIVTDIPVPYIPQALSGFLGMTTLLSRSVPDSPPCTN